MTKKGKSLFEMAVRVIKPEILIFGLGRDHLKGTQFEFLYDAPIIQSPELPNNPKKIIRADFSSIAGQKIFAANGSANMKPFNHFGKEFWSKCGAAIKKNSEKP